MNNVFKKVVVSTAALSLLSAAAVFAEEPVLINQEPETDISVSVDAAAPVASINTPFEVIDGVTMLPLRAIAEHFGYSVEWLEESQTVTITKGAKQITFSINEDRYAFSRMAAQPLGAAPVLVDDCTTYVPMSFFTELVGLNCRIADGECISAMPTIVSVLAIEEDGSLLVNDDFYGSVIVKIGENTEIVANGETVSADMIAAEQMLAVEYDSAFTRSIPPQTTAVKIELLNLAAEGETEEEEVAEATAVDVKVLDIEEDGAVLVEDPNLGEVIVRISDETVITRNGEAAAAADIKEGGEISVVYADYMTMSIPAQTAAISIAIK